MKILKISCLKMKTFWDAIIPVRLLNWVLGTMVIEYPFGHPRRIISTCLAFAHLIIYVVLIWMGQYSDTEVLARQKIEMSGHLIQFISNPLAMVTFMFLGQAKSKTVVICMSKLNRLTKVMSQLGIPNDYGSTFRIQSLTLCGNFLFLSATRALSIMRKYHTNSNNKVFPILPLVGTSGNILYTFAVLFIVEFTFTDCVRYIRNRFRQLNEYLVKLNVERQKTKPFLLLDIPHHDNVRRRPVRSGLSMREETRLTNVLRMSKQLHADLCAIAMELNAAYSIQILIFFILSFCDLVLELFQIFDILESTNFGSDHVTKIILIAMWLGQRMGVLFFLITNCARTSNEARRTGELIYDLVKPMTSIKIKEEIHGFSLQLMQDPLHFTASGFFAIDHSLIRAMIETVSTYLVIVIHMRVINQDRK